jgi:hypothetical protein
MWSLVVCSPRIPASASSHLHALGPDPPFERHQYLRLRRLESLQLPEHRRRPVGGNAPGGSGGPVDPMGPGQRPVGHGVPATPHPQQAGRIRRGPVRVPGQAVLRAVRHPRVRRRRAVTTSTRPWPRRSHRLPGGRSRRRCRSVAAARPAASSSPTTPTRCASTPATSWAWTSRATPSRSSGSSTPPTSPRSTTPASRSTVRQEAPRHALGRGRRRDRGGRRDEPRRHRQDLDRPGRRPRPRPSPATWVSCRQAEPGRHRRRRRHPPEAVHGLHRGRRRPDRDQPADPQAHRRGARTRRQGHPRRQRRRSATPSTRPTRPPRSATSASRRRTRGLQYVGLDGSVGIIANGAGLAMSHARRGQPGRRRPPTSWTSAAAPTPTSDGRGARGHQQRPRVKSIFINIFGGITRGEEVANGIITALGRVDHRRTDRDPPRRHQRRRGSRDPRAASVRQVADGADHAGSRRRPSSSPPPLSERRRETDDVAFSSMRTPRSSTRA